MSTKYDVAISFAGEDRRAAQKLADLLSKRGLRVFFDSNASGDLWGKDLYDHLRKVYEESSLCIVLVSAYASQSQWTKYEFEQLTARATRQPWFSILPVRVDDSPLPSTLKTTAFVDLNRTSPEHLTDIVKRRLAEVRPRKRSQRQHYHVIRRETGWSVKKEGRSRASSIHDTKQQAVAAAKRHAAEHGPSSIVVHRVDGTIESDTTID